MYRIMLASSGYYYVQNHSGWNGWNKIGGFFKTRKGARRFIDRLRDPYSSNVVEYY